ncbi:MAG: hypothetical protein JOZ43_06835 [Acidobacteriales bacterium]|nr:hypothetical protein [Terriglobales bacterium]
MFSRRIAVEYASPQGAPQPCPVKWIDNFAMRNFTNDAIFDDTLPVADGELEVGKRISLDRLQSSMEDWFRRKGYLKSGESVRVREIAESEAPLK